MARRLFGRGFCISVVSEAEMRFGLVHRPLTPGFRASLERLLSTIAISPLDVRDSAKALERLRSAATAVDVALLDQRVPRLDGWAFLRAVRESERDRQLPVALISAAPLQPPDGFPGDLRFDWSAMKPLSQARLAQILEGLLDLERTYHDQPAPTKTASAAATLVPSARPAEELRRFCPRAGAAGRDPALGARYGRAVSTGSAAVR